MTVSAAIQEKSKEIFKLLAEDRPLLQHLHNLAMVELAKDTPDLKEVTDGILSSSNRTVTISSGLINQLLSDYSVEDLQPQLDVIFRKCAEELDEEALASIDQDLAQLIREHAEFSKRLNSEMVGKYGPNAIENALKKSNTLEAFVDGVKDIPGFNEVAMRVAEESDALATEMSPIVAQGMAGEII